METKPRFDLNTALRHWREELSAQLSLSVDEQRELEFHLLDTIADLRKRGLNEEEAFWLARRRLGPAQELGLEFTKANPSKVWRERFFWAALVTLIFQLWSLAFGTLSQAVINYRVFLPDWVLYYFCYNPSGVPSQWLTNAVYCTGVLLYFLPVIYALISLGRNKSNIAPRALEYALSSKLRLLSLAGISYLLLATLQSCIAAKVFPSLPFYNLTLFAAPFRNVGLLALACWLMPSRPRTDTTERTLRRA